MPKILLPLDIRAKNLARPNGFGSVRVNAVDGAAEVFIYGEIGGWWDGIQAEDVVKELRDIDAEQISVRINSPGGAVFDGVAIYNALAAHPAEITVHVEGIAASIASVIAMAGDKIVIGEAASLMIHKPWSFVMGDAEVMRKEAAVLDTLEGGLVDIYAARTDLKKDDIKNLLGAETWYRGQEAVDAGFADEVAAAKKKKYPKSDLLALFKNAKIDAGDVEDNATDLREFEQVLRTHEQMPHRAAKRIAALAAKTLRPVRDEQAPGHRDDDLPSQQRDRELRDLAARIRQLTH
jgi:ATP-dependent protease ClpP protease subunit